MEGRGSPSADGPKGPSSQQREKFSAGESKTGTGPQGHGMTIPTSHSRQNEHIVSYRWNTRERGLLSKGSGEMSILLGPPSQFSSIIFSIVIRSLARKIAKACR